jgi:hypothetical protein
MFKGLSRALHIACARLCCDLSGFDALDLLLAGADHIRQLALSDRQFEYEAV